MSKGGVLKMMPNSMVNNLHPKIPNTPTSNIIQKVFFIGITLAFFYMCLGIKVESSLLDLSSIGQTIINIIPGNLTIIKEYLIYLIWSLITYPFTWCFGRFSDVDIPDSNIRTTDISSGLTETFSSQNKDLDELDADSEDIKDHPPSYKASEKDNDVIKPNTHKKNTDNIAAKKIAYQYGRKQALLKHKSIGAASVTPQEIATAQIQAREEVLKQHKIRGASSITLDEISEAFNNGKKQVLQSYKLRGLKSLVSEEVSNAFNSSRKAKEPEEQLELTTRTQENIQTSIQIALLRTFSKQTGDPYIVAKIMFSIKLNQCFEQHPQNPECIDKSIKYTNITSSENILSDNKFEHVTLGQKFSKEMPEEIPYKKWFCDLISECKNNHNTSYCLERTQNVTGLSYTNDDFCPSS